MKTKKELLKGLIVEVSMILSKRTALDSFIKSSNFKKLTHIESVLIRNQLDAMDNYINILDCRLSLYSKFNRNRGGK